jgi:hypothetical protein
MCELSYKEYLEGVTKDRLVQIMKLTGFRYSGLRKDDIIEFLNVYMQNEQNVESIWNSLSPFEKEYMNEFLKYDEPPIYNVLQHLYHKYGIKESYFRDPREILSKMSLFFIDKSIAPQLKKQLQKHIKPIVIHYDALYELPEDDQYHTTIVGERFTEDFCNMLDLADHDDLTLTQVKRLPTKRSVLKMNHALSNKDFIFKDYGQIDWINNIEDTNRIFGIFMLMAASYLIRTDGKTIRTTGEAFTFRKQNPIDQCKTLFEYYLKSQRINELHRIVESVFRTAVAGNLETCREVIIKHIRRCPVGLWVRISQFMDYIKMQDKNFLIDQVRYISCFSDKHKIYTEPWVDWEEVEGRFIEVALLEYLSVMGIVDIVFCEREGGSSDYDLLPFFKVEYFRITSLGASVLGMNSEH